MKKLVFTAIAMIAFCGASIAETGKIEKTVLLRDPNCVIAATYVYEWMQDLAGATEEDIPFLNALISSCDK